MAISAALVAIWALFFGLVPWLLESPDSWLYYLGISAGDFGNVGAVWLLASVVGSIALPLYLTFRFDAAMDAIGLAPLVSVEMASPGTDEKPGEWPDRFANRRVLAAVKTLHSRAEKVDSVDFEDPFWPELQAELASRLSALDDALLCYLPEVEVRAEALAGMSLDDLAESGSSGREAQVAKEVEEELGPVTDALLAAYEAFSKLLLDLGRSPVNGVARARTQLDDLDKALATAEAAVFSDGGGLG